MILTEELSQQGHQVFETLAISEVLALAYAHPAATVIIKSEISPERALAVQQHSPTMHLKSCATVTDIIWELNVKDATVQ